MGTYEYKWILEGFIMYKMCIYDYYISCEIYVFIFMMHHYIKKYRPSKIYLFERYYKHIFIVSIINQYKYL